MVFVMVLIIRIGAGLRFNAQLDYSLVLYIAVMLVFHLFTSHPAVIIISYR